MRNTFHCLCLAALSLLAVACIPSLDNHPLPQGENLLTASIAAEPATRTTLSPEQDGISKVLWADNDAIGVFVDGVPESNIYRLIAGAGSKQATFAGTGRGVSYIAVYPSDIVKSLSGETVSVELPSVQDFTKESFANGAFPMVAVSSTSDLSFRNLCSVLKISMTGHHSVSRLVFRSNDPAVKVCGPATVSLSNPSAPSLTVSKDGCDSLVVETGGILLADDEATDFYLVLPAQTYKGGFTVRIVTSTGYMVKKLDSDFTMVRGQKHDAKAFAVKLDEGVEPSADLAGSGTEKDPFRINSLGDLLLMQSAVNSKGGRISGRSGASGEAAKAYYLLTADLDLSPLCSQNLKKSWVPIGDRSTSEEFIFSGVFDGGGHTVSGLYIDTNNDYQALFGYSKGVIRNLTVDGNVVSQASYVALIAGFGHDIENCVSTGFVEGNNYEGGITGEGYNVSFCTNRAYVGGSYCVGGIAGYSYGRVTNCFNEGHVYATSNGYRFFGGITGYQNGGQVLNCCNRADVYGATYGGGISGILSQGTKCYNCINVGNVTCSDDYVGGICGILTSIWDEADYFSAMANCVNVGKAMLSGGKSDGYIGALAGFSGFADIWNNGGEENNFALVKQCYWSYDTKNGHGQEIALGGGNGRTENNVALTDEQLKDGNYDGILYAGSDGSTYSTLLKALNAFAYDLRRQSSLPVSGWDFDSSGSYPVPTDLDAQRPGGEKAVFELSGNDASFLVAGGEFSVSVTSSLEYTRGTLPGWVSEISVRDKPAQPHTHVHSFAVTANTSGAPRQCEITFTNKEGKVCKVRVDQKAPYLTISTTELVFSDTRSSKRIAVSSSIDWVVSSAAESGWYEISPNKGSGDGAVTVVVDNNLQPTAREGSLVVASADGSIRHEIHFVQSAYKGEEESDWKTLPFYHQSVIMRFTATWCTWCPYMNHSICRAQELYPDKLQHLALHGGGSDLEFDLTNKVMSQYKSNAYPTGIVDGRIQVSNSTDIDAVAARFIAASKETEDTYGTVSGLGIQSTSSGQRVDIDIDAYFKVAGDYKITVLLLEDGIINPQVNGGDDYVHDNVVRVSASNILGDAFKIGSDLSQRSFHYSVSVPADNKIENMRVLAYIQKSFGSASRIQSDEYGDYYIDNCATAPVGEVLRVALVGGGSGGSGGNNGGNGNEGITPGGEIK